MTNYELICEMQKAFGKRPANDLTCDDVNLQRDLIQEEWEELQIAIQEGYLPEIRKELCDLLVVAYGLGYLLGFDVDKDFKAVHENNMSKLHKSYSDAKVTSYYYLERDIPTYVEQVLDFKYFVVKRTRDDKVMKPINYKKLDMKNV